LHEGTPHTPLPFATAWAATLRALSPQSELEQAEERRRLADEWGRYLSAFHWNLYLKPTFRTPVSGEYARGAGVELVKSMGEKAYGVVAWGEGSVGGRMHIHLLIGGVVEGKARSTGFDRTLWYAKKVRALWRHGVVKSEPYNPRLGAAKYLPWKHELELVGEPKRHRVRRTQHRP
jgi:hypothetical protein